MSCFKTASDDTFTTYTYDSNGNRIRSEVNGNAVNYLIDESFVYPQVVSEYDDLGTVTTEYHRGLGLISMYNGINERFYRYDALGSVRALSDGNSVTDTYDYDAYGEIRTRTGTTENSFMFTGEQYDEETGNYYLRARYYNPSSGQFISRDSWEGDDRNPITLNKYAYANSNPAMFTDPSGHWGMMEVSAIQSVVDTMSQTAMGLYRLIIESPEKTAKRDKTVLFKNRYYLTEDHAAWDATNFINPLSIQTNKEHGGWVVKEPADLLFYATVPMPGTENKFNPDIWKPKGAEKSRLFAVYHTHGAESSDYKSEEFSTRNYDFGKTSGDIAYFVANEVNGYLGTPKGWFWKWEKQQGIVWNPWQKIVEWDGIHVGFLHPNFPIVSTSYEEK
jgi:RHS repeat-associated protein